jgi:predicted TPR repeat methyltransferase
MVAQAESKQLYDRLVTGELAAFLKGELDKGERYDLVVAADVFVYVNDLAPVLAAATKTLAPGGVFAFTVETHPGEGVKLLQTLRYAHGEPYNPTRACRSRPVCCFDSQGGRAQRKGRTGR